MHVLYFRTSVTGDYTQSPPQGLNGLVCCCSLTAEAWDGEAPSGSVMLAWTFIMDRAGKWT